MNSYREYTLSKKRKRPMDLVLYILIYLSAAFAVLLLASIIIYVLIRGINSVNWRSPEHWLQIQSCFFLMSQLLV